MPRPIETECVNCGAPQGERVVRAHGNHLRWSMDLELAYRDGATWMAASKVYIFQKTGLCRSCQGAKAVA